MAHYNYFQHITEDANIQKLGAALLVGAGLVVLGRALTRKISTESQVKEAIVPSSRLSLFGVFDLVIESFISFQDSILGKENRHYVPFTCSVFLFVFFANLLGLIPGMPASTTTVWVNVGLAMVVFMFFNYEGIKANGLGGYLKHFCGPVIILAPVIFFLEILSTCLRLLTLNLRLYWNITADHTVLGAFTDLTKVLIPCLFYAMGTFVAFMQAFVFTILTMIYILLATQHSEDH